MTIGNTLKFKINELKREFDALRKDKADLLKLIDEAEVPESVYNSNAIENSTLTLAETEKIIMKSFVPKEAELREIFEAKNLANVMDYIRSIANAKDVSKNLLLELHEILMESIDTSISGRFRNSGEYVRVGTHIGSPPEKIETHIEDLLLDYTSDNHKYFLDKIAEFHLKFESIHPFNDGNGRIGRVLVNFQLMTLGFPNIIVKNKEKLNYYSAFNEYNDSKRVKIMTKIIGKALTESLHKRLAYLKGFKIIKLSEYAKINGFTGSSLFNSAKKQTIPAFREKGVWKIGV